MKTNEKGSERIAELLAAYGSDVTRWPEEGRMLIGRLSSQERAEMLREDRALDTLISSSARTSNTTPAPEALIARIMEAAAARSATPVATKEGKSKIVALRPASIDHEVEQQQQRSPSHDWAAAAALLAASLVVGIFIGSTDLGRSTAAMLGDFAGFDVSTSTLQTTALDEALQAQDDEDLL